MQVDQDGYVYIAGTTYSANYPVTPGAFMTTSKAGQNCGIGSCVAGFITKLNPAGSQLVYSTFFPEPIISMALDANGNVFVTGQILDTNYSTTAGALDNPNGKIFVAKLNASGSSLSYAARFGSTGVDDVSAIAVDGSGDTYVAGWSYATDYPVTPGAFATPETGAFVTELNDTGSAFVYSARLGGSDRYPIGGLGTRPLAIAVDDAHEALMASRPHRDNLLSPKFNVAGFGVFRQGHMLYVAQDFGLSMAIYSVQQAKELVSISVEKLRAQKVSIEELILPDEIHDLLRWTDWVRSYKATADFFNRKLAATPQP